MCLFAITKEKPQNVSRAEHTSIKYLTVPKEAVREAAGSPDLSHIDMSPPAASREDLSSPVNVRGLQTSFHGSKSILQNPFSSILEVQRLNPPLRPQLTSTVLYPTYTPRSRHSKSPQPELRLQERNSRGDSIISFPRGSSKVDSMSSFQVDYWTCAIPKTLPPSPNRQSADWNPNKEYNALLDYTYPLRPGHVDCEWNSSELQGDSFLKTNPNMQDSGIELDHFCSSASLSGFEFSESGEEKTRDSGTFCASYRSPDRQGFPKSSGGPSFSSPVSLTKSMSLVLDSMDCSRDEDETGYHSRKHYNHQHNAASSFISTSFVCSTSVLPPSRCVCGEVDEEFLPLPDQLEELQQLSRQVRAEYTCVSHTPKVKHLQHLQPGHVQVGL